MKRTTLLFLLLLAFTAPWVANAHDMTHYAIATGQNQTHGIRLNDAITQIVASGQEDTASSRTESETIVVDAANPFFEGFENDFAPLNWVSIPYESDSTTYQWNSATTNHSGSYSAYSGSYGPIYLVMPNLELATNGIAAQLTFWTNNTNVSIYGKNSVVLFNGNEEIELWSPTSVVDGWEETTIDLTAYMGQTISLAFKYEGNNAHGWYVDDVAVFVYTKSFVGSNDDGAWDNEDNWSPVGVPGLEDNVIILANNTIFANVVATANKITFGDNGTLTIANKAQLQTNYDVEATVIKHVRGWDGDCPEFDGELDGEEDGGELKDPANENYNYYLIANPMNTQAGTPATYGMTTEDIINNNGNVIRTYDLYRWDYTEEYEWRNYRQDAFSLANGQGYLYSNIDCMELVFMGTGDAGKVRANNATLSQELTYEAGQSYDFNGWNLLGNPFVCNVYIDQPFYRMKTPLRNEIIAAEEGDAIAPMEGFFVMATGENQFVNISRNPMNRGGHLDMNLTCGRSTMDKAIISFGEGSNLGKFQLNPNHSKVYMTQNGKDYAVLHAESQGEIPVSFKAETNDTYTMNFNAEGVSFNYLHLIDNLTGADIDLLAVPSYSFDACTTDYASRFRLVFSTGSNNSEDNFTFFSNGNLVINNEGKATLQIMDMMGRILKNENINGCVNINVNGTAGVYMVRLINGDNVRVQKVVVK